MYGVANMEAASEVIIEYNMAKSTQLIEARRGSSLETMTILLQECKNHKGLYETFAINLDSCWMRLNILIDL